MFTGLAILYPGKDPSFHDMGLTHIMNSKGQRVSPWYIPRLNCDGSVSSTPDWVLTLSLVFHWVDNFLIVFVIANRILCSSSAFSSHLWLTLS